MRRLPFILALLFCAVSVLLAQNDPPIPQNCQIKNQLTGAEYRRWLKGCEKAYKTRDKVRKIREKEAMDTPVRVMFRASAPQIKPLILRRMLDQGSNLFSDSDSRLTFWERLGGGSGFAYALGASVAGRGNVRPELHIDFILISLGNETEVRVLCNIAETSERHGNTTSREAGSCGWRNLSFTEMLESIRVELSAPPEGGD
jgi:hypothetical protein